MQEAGKNHSGSANAVDSSDKPVALVTGGSGGIGGAVASLFAERMIAVALCYYRNAAKANQVAECIRAKGGEVLALQCDVTEFASVKGCVDEVEKRWGRIDFLVNSAGGAGKRMPLVDYDPASWGAVIKLNLDGTYNCCRAVLPLMLRQKSGHIVNISSGHSRTGGVDGVVPYAAAKAGVNILTRGLAREMAGSGVLVNAVAAGLTDTPLHDGNREHFERRSKVVPLGRAAQPGEIAETVYFLCKNSTYTTGEVLFVTGGL